MIVDSLTKGLPPKTFNDHVERMGVIGKVYVLYCLTLWAQLKNVVSDLNVSCCIMLVYIHEWIMWIMTGFVSDKDINVGP